MHRHVVRIIARKWIRVDATARLFEWGYQELKIWRYSLSCEVGLVNIWRAVPRTETFDSTLQFSWARNHHMTLSNARSASLYAH